MKFGEKYELQESLTTGAIETFAANDKIRGESVLVHIVECDPQRPEQTMAEWVLESFRKLAPEPPGLVLETGKYNGPKYAYVVIKPAEETAVKAWVRRYEVQAQETKETRVRELRVELSSPAAVTAPLVQSAVTPSEPVQPTGSMTQLFRDFDSLTKSKMPSATNPPDSPAVRSAPPTSLLGESGVHAAVPWDPASAKASTPKESRVATPPAPPKPIAPEMPVSGARGSGKPGEFTNFFQGPFRGESSDMPSLSSQPIEPPKKNVGEFTALFGQASPSAASSPTPPSAAESSFTSIFKDMRPAQPTFNPPTPGPVIPVSPQPLPSIPSMNVAPLPDPVFVAPTPTPVVAPTPSIPAIPPSPGVAGERSSPPRPSSLPGDGATNAFMRPSSEPAPMPAEVQSGPSPYTQIISRRDLPPEEGEASSASSPGAGAGGAKFAAPPIPKAPAPPPIPKMPPAPKLAPPPKPQLKTPPMPKAPKIDAPAPPPVSILPLVITLTVLFLLAVGLVLFFVLRH